MIKNILFLALLTITSLIGSVFADLEGYIITDYHVDMTLHSDASMDVTETINVNFSKPRHGIYREIPLIDDTNAYLSLSNIQVQGDPIANQSTTNDILTLQIGDPDITITGPKRYLITYTVQNAITIYSGWTELYRNVIGTQRNTSIAKASRSINLPKEYLPDSSGTFAVRGGYGEKFTGDIDFTSLGIGTGSTGFIGSSTWIGLLNHPLNPNQGITIGMKFPSDYFSFPNNYGDFFTKSNFTEITNSDRWTQFINFIETFGIWIIFFAISIGGSWLKNLKTGPRKSDRPVTIYYNPPKEIDPSLAFYFWHNNPLEPKVFTALLYYRASRGWVTIKKEKSEGFLGFFSKDQYHVLETSNDPAGANDLDKTLLQNFFGTFDTVNDDITLTQQSHSSIKSLLSTLSYKFKDQAYTQPKEGFLSYFGARELTLSGKDIFEQLRGYKEFLTKVERPVIEQELKTDPDFINKILPRAVLFGVETRLLKMIEDLLASLKRYQSNDGTFLTYYAFSSMNSSFQSYTLPPRSSHSSGFGGGGGFSGGGGGGGGGGSW